MSDHTAPIGIRWRRLEVQIMRSTAPTPIERVGGTAFEQVIVRGVIFPANNGTDELEFSLVADTGDKTTSGFVRFSFEKDTNVLNRQIRTGHCEIDADAFTDTDPTDHSGFIVALATRWIETDLQFAEGRPVLVLREIDGGFRPAPEIHRYITDLYERSLGEVRTLLSEASSGAQVAFYGTLERRLVGLIRGCNSRHDREIGEGTPLVRNHEQDVR